MKIKYKSNTCIAYEIDNPASPDEIESLATMANSAARNMIKLPTNSNRTASQLEMKENDWHETQCELTIVKRSK